METSCEPSADGGGVKRRGRKLRIPEAAGAQPDKDGGHAEQELKVERK